MMLLKTIIKVLAPFVILLNDIIYGALVYIKLETKIEVDKNLFYLLSHICGSSIYVVLYIICHSTHMCVYYKSSCYMLLNMHIFTIMYLYTDITFIRYLYYMGVMGMFTFIMWVASLFALKTAKTINQSCKH